MFFETIPGGGAQQASWGGGQKSSKPRSSQGVRPVPSGRAESWLSSDQNGDTPGQRSPGILKWQLIVSSTSCARK